MDWLVATARSRRRREFPGLDHDFFDPLLDYTAEDAYLASVTLSC